MLVLAFLDPSKTSSLDAWGEAPSVLNVIKAKIGYTQKTPISKNVHLKKAYLKNIITTFLTI